MITTSDVISFIENLIKSNIDFNVSIYRDVEVCWSDSIYVNDNSVLIQLNTVESTVYIRNHNLTPLIIPASETDMLDLKKLFIQAEECSKLRSEYKFIHYFDNINKVDKTIDNLDDDED